MRRRRLVDSQHAEPSAGLLQEQTDLLGTLSNLASTFGLHIGLLQVMVTACCRCSHFFIQYIN